jgi:hypothetical protein
MPENRNYPTVAGERIKKKYLRWFRHCLIPGDRHGLHITCALGFTLYGKPKNQTVHIECIALM